VASVTWAALRLLFALVGTLGLSGCSAWSGPDQTLDAAGPADTRTATGMIAQFRDAYRASAANAANPALATNFQGAGLALVQSHCDDFFNNIGHVRQRTNLLQRGLALGGATAATILGLTGASAKAIALVAAGITGAIGASEIFADELLFGPDVAAVQQLIATEMATYNAAVWQLGQPPSFYSAHSNIQGAQNICEIQHIRARVNEAVRAGRFSRDIDSEEAARRQACNYLQSHNILPLPSWCTPAQGVAGSSPGSPANPFLQSRPILRIN
jgi:hypothetical protein